MKNNLLAIAVAALFPTVYYAQAPKYVLDKTNTREGESVEYCSQHKKLNEILKNPDNLKLWQQEEAKVQQQLMQKGKGTDITKGTIYKIPVVFHVLHNGGVENISDEQIYDALYILNRDYRLQNADASTVVADFDGVITQGSFEPQPSDVEIEFVLATKAPNGACFKGITRTQSTLSYDGSNGGAQVTAIKNGNDVYQGTWSGTKYMNVYICGDIGGAAGYTQYPMFGGTGMDNGIWVLHNYVGSIGTSSGSTSRTLTHESGHWLNLPHVWGSTNNPGIASNCNSDDGVSDTPNCIGVTTCNKNSNSCNSDDAFFGFAIKDNVQNYMDYSYCSVMFTQGQVDRMRLAIQSSTGGRNNLWTPSNLTATGATGVLTLCKADFAATRTTICAGDSVQFIDDTYNAVTGWNWSFTGGSPTSSTTQNPYVTYNTPGLYTVTLNATDGSTNDGETKTNYIHVLPASASIPLLEGFESYSSIDAIEEWQIVNPSNNNKFTLESTFGLNSNKCVRLTNYGQPAGNIDELISSAVDLSGVTSQNDMTLSFRYAYRKKVTGNSEILKVFITKDCGENWVQRKTISGNGLSSLTSSSSWTPTNSDWVTVHMTNVTQEYWVDNFRYKFVFESDGGNNLFLDNINIYEGDPSETLVVGLSEEGEINELAVYPNPTEGDVNIRFSVANQDNAIILVQDLAGKIVEQQNIMAQPGANLVMLDAQHLAAGSYLMTIQIQGAKKTVPFVIK